MKLLEQITSAIAESSTKGGLAYGKHQFNVNLNIVDIIHNKT